MAIFSSLSRQQKEAVGLLQIGTFLEYFDLMLYVHMAVLLNELFFPKTDPHTAALLSAFAFCSTFLFRPLGALFFGYIGDQIGRKSTVIITTLMMAVSCLVMANLPTYAKIGIIASWVVTICRVLQGLSSLGEIVGADIYLTEITRPPARYPIVALTECSGSLGSLAALGVANLVTMVGLNWRLAFLFGVVIATVGSVARTRLRETPDFIKMQARRNKFKDATQSKSISVENTSVDQIKVDSRTALAYFFAECGWPVCFYFSYVYCADVLKNVFNYTSADIIHQNFWVAVAQILSFAVFTRASYLTHPLKLLKIRVKMFLPFVILLPLILAFNQSWLVIFLVQLFCMIFVLSVTPAYAVYIIHFPVLKRFTYLSMLYALSRAAIYAITSFGMVYLTHSLSYYGLWIIMLPITVGYFWSINYFEKLENQKQHQVHTPHPLSIKPDELKAAR